MTQPDAEHGPGGRRRGYSNKWDRLFEEADERASLPQPAPLAAGLTSAPQGVEGLDVERLATDAYKAGYEDGGQVYEHSNRDRYARAYGKRIAAEYARLSQGDR